MRSRLPRIAMPEFCAARRRLSAVSGGLASGRPRRPTALNALNRELRGAIERTFRELQKDGETRVVLLTGAGRAFSAGIDLKELGSASSMSTSGVTEASMIAALHDFEG